MCNVCVASAVLNATLLGDAYNVTWHPSCDDWLANRRRAARSGARTVQMQATGRAEGRARYRLRLKGQRWPSKWSRTPDLAGAVGAYGFDVKWELVPLSVRSWIRGKGRKPTAEAEREQFQKVRAETLARAA